MRNLNLTVASLAICVSSHAAFAQGSLTIRTGKPEPLITGLPFAADEDVRTVQQLANGVTLSREMKGRVYRSSQGVQRFEGTLVATDPDKPAPSTSVWVVDPIKHIALSWNTSAKVATLIHLPAGSTTTVRLLSNAATSRPAQQAQPENVTTTSLGHQTKDKVYLVGKRVTGTIPIGRIGNEQPLVVTTDVWMSPDLKLLVNELDQDPRTGNRIVELTHIQREEPDAALFEAPEGYTVRERPTPGTLFQTQQTAPDAHAQQIAEARGQSDPQLKNDLAYRLAMDKVDLPDAQTLAEQAVQMEEQQTVSLDLKNPGSEAFSQMTTLSVYWNTLGWVYFRQGKLTQAESYTRAAWELDPRGYFGAHLGRIYEQENRIKDAITIYRMALSTRASAKEREQIEGRLTDLGAAHAEPLPLDVAAPLPSLKSARGPDGDALFDVMLTHDNPPAVVFLKGSSALKESAATAIQADLHASLPDSGPEKVLRRARVRCSGDGPTACTLLLLTPMEAKGAAFSSDN